MCDLHDHHGLPPLEADEYVLDTPFVRELVAAVRERIDRSASAADACERIRPVFEQALMQRDWLPAEFKRDVPESGMGGGIGQWLLFRSADRSLCLFSLVVPPGSMTPIHDHLAWGLVGLYQGNQDEEFYDPRRGQHRAHPPAPAGPRRLLRPPPAGRRHPPRADDLGGDIGLDPPAGERHGVRGAPHLRRPHRRGPPVSLRLRERDLRGGIRQLSRQAAERRWRRRGPQPPSTRRACPPARRSAAAPAATSSCGRPSCRAGSFAPPCRGRAGPAPG